MSGRRTRQAFGPAEVLSRSHEANAQAVVTVGGGYVPDYTNAKQVVITASALDPNASAPTAAQIINATLDGVVAFFLKFEHVSGSAGSVAVWAHTGDTHGWVKVQVDGQESATILNPEENEEFLVKTGQREVFIQVAGTTNVDNSGSKDCTIVATSVG